MTLGGGGGGCGIILFAVIFMCMRMRKRITFDYWTWCLACLLKHDQFGSGEDDRRGATRTRFCSTFPRSGPVPIYYSIFCVLPKTKRRNAVQNFDFCVELDI